MALPHRPCPLRSALFFFFFFASFFDFSLETFQEPEFQGSAGQRAFVRHQAGEGRAREDPRLRGAGDVCVWGARNRVVALGRACPPRAATMRARVFSQVVHCGPGRGAGDPSQRKGRGCTPLRAPPEAAVIFVSALQGSLGPARGGGRVLESDHGVFLTGGAFPRLREAWERAPQASGLQSGPGLAAAKSFNQKPRENSRGSRGPLRARTTLAR